MRRNKGFATTIMALTPALGALTLAWWPSLARLVLACWPWRCPLWTIAGIACPTCGLGRGLVAVAQGHWQVGWDYHPLAPMLAIAYGCGLSLWLVVRGGAAMRHLRWHNRP